MIQFLYTSCFLFVTGQEERKLRCHVFYSEGPIGLSDEVDQEIIIPELNDIEAPAPARAPVERPIEYCQVAVTPQQKRRSEIPFSAAGNEHRRMRKTGSGLFCSRNE